MHLNMKKHSGVPQNVRKSRRTAFRKREKVVLLGFRKNDSILQTDNYVQAKSSFNGVSRRNRSIPIVYKNAVYSQITCPGVQFTN